jgi:hypothetical protein
MYNVNWNNVIKSALPPRLYKTTIVAWLSVFAKYFQELHARLIDYSNEVNKKLKYNSQVCYLEAALNDKFDPIKKEIKINDAGGSRLIPLQRDRDSAPVIIGSDAAGPAMILQPDSGYTGGDYDFIVSIPQRIAGDIPESRLHSLLNYYKLAGKKYDTKTA